MSMNAVSANLNMSTALRIREEAMDMNVSLSSHVSNLIEESLSARDSKQVIFDDQEALNEYLIDDSTGCEAVPWEPKKEHLSDNPDPDFDIKAPSPEFDPDMFKDTYEPDPWYKRWWYAMTTPKKDKKEIHGTFGEDPEEYLRKKEMDQIKQEIFELKEQVQHQGRADRINVDNAPRFTDTVYMQDALKRISTDSKYEMKWGTYGVPQGPLQWVRLIDCSTEHLNNILGTQRHIMPRMRRIIHEILNDRRAV